MYEKYMVREDQLVFAIKFENQRREMVIGGVAREAGKFHRILEQFFNTQPRKTTHPQHSRIRYIVDIKEADFRNGMKLMQEEGFQVESVKSLGNIMR
jgi:hypothetical protein